MNDAIPFSGEETEVWRRGVLRQASMLCFIFPSKKHLSNYKFSLIFLRYFHKAILVDCFKKLKVDTVNIS